MHWQFETFSVEKTHPKHCPEQIKRAVYDFYPNYGWDGTNELTHTGWRTFARHQVHLWVSLCACVPPCVRPSVRTKSCWRRVLLFAVIGQKKKRQRWDSVAAIGTDMGCTDMGCAHVPITYWLSGTRNNVHETFVKTLLYVWRVCVSRCESAAGNVLLGYTRRWY